MTQAILPLFSQLWAHNSDIRIGASAKLVHHLHKTQAAYIQEGIHSSNNNDTAASAAYETTSQFHGLANDVNYSLKRLIRGLASPRDSSRLGFAVALTELLTRLDNISIRDVLPVLLSNSQPSSSSKGSEERDLLFARLFGLHSLISSGLIFKPNTSTIHDWRTIIEELLVLGEKKVWLRESAGWIVQNATKALMKKKAEQVQWKEEGLQAVLQAAFDPTLSGEGKSGASSKKANNAGTEWTLERLALVILLQEESSASIDWEGILKPTFQDVSLLSSSKNIPTLTRLLKGSSTTSTENSDATAQSLFGTGGLHYVWNELLEAYFPAQGSGSEEIEKQQQPSKKKAKVIKGQQQQQEKIPFTTLYKAVVDDALFGQTSSLASKYIGLQIFSLALSKISTAAASSSSSPIPSTITSNLLRTLINHLSKKDRTLHGIALQASLSIPLSIKADPSIGYEVLLEILSKKNGGNIRFDSVTKTKTVEGIVENMDAKSVERYTEWLMLFVVNAGETTSEDEEEEEGMQVDGKAGQDEEEDEDEQNENALSKRSENERAWAMDQLLLIIRKHYSPASVKGTEPAPQSLPAWCISILQFLSLHGFFSLQKPSSKSSLLAMKFKPVASKPFTASTQALFRTRFFSALTHILNGVSPKMVSLQKDLMECIRKECFERFEADQKHVRILAAEEDVEERRMTYRLLERVQSTQSDKNRSDAISLLVQVLLLQAYTPESGATDGLEQLRDAVEALFPASSSSSSSNKISPSEDDDQGVEAEPISILIDLLVDILQKPAVLTRTVAERVFTAFSGEVKEQALQLLLDQVSPEEEQETEDEEGEDDSEEDGTEASQPNGKSAKKGKEAASADDSESSSSDEDDSADDDDEDLGINLDVDPELRDKVAAALASMGVGAAEEDDDDDEEEEEEQEPDLNDDQMMELDEQLAEIFRSRKAAAKDSKAAVQNSLNARLRILDLLDLYAKNQASNPLILHTTIPLLNVARQANGQEDELAAKANRILLSMSKPKEYPEITETVPILTMLSSIHATARRHSRAELADTFSSTSLFLSRIILTSSENRNVTDIADIYTATLTDYLSRKSSRIQGNFFTSFIKRFKSAAWELNEPLVEACSEETITDNKHKRIQCFGLLGDLLTSHASLKTKEAYDDILSAMPRIVEMVIPVFQAAADGTGMKFEVHRLREIFKFCTQAIRATRIALNGRPEPNVHTVWKSEELERVLEADMSSSSLEKGASLAPQIRNLLASVKQGTGGSAAVSSNGKPEKALQQKPVVSEKKGGKKQKRKAGEMEAAL